MEKLKRRIDQRYRERSSDTSGGGRSFQETPLINFVVTSTNALQVGRFRQSLISQIRKRSF